MNNLVIGSSTTIALFSAAFNRAVEQSHGVALWTQAGSENFHLLIDRSPENELRPVSWNSGEKGFIIHSFEHKAGEQSLLLKPDLHVQLNNLGEDELEQLEQYVPTQQDFPYAKLDTLSFEGEENEQSDYTCKVEHLLEELQNKSLKKIVLARHKKHPFPGEKSPVETAIELRKIYPNAFVALCFHPTTGCWIGASPELLVSQDQQGIFQTIALAGTQAYDVAKSLKEHTWNNKEIEEQALVTRYIINCFKTIRLREYEEEGPKNYLAGNLVHLCTQFKVNTSELNIQDLPDQMLPLLHPTSATCGEPKNRAMELILQYENSPRNLYAGFWGSINLEEKSAVYVNLRCAQLFSNGYKAYAGAGITADSIPAHEWTETEHKMASIQKIWSPGS